MKRLCAGTMSKVEFNDTSNSC